MGVGGISVGGIEYTRKQFAPQLLPHVDHLPHTHDPTRNAFSRGQPAWGAHLADDLEAIVARRGAGTIAAVIVEPIAGSTGVLVPPKGYLDRLRAICDSHGILLSFDEVICGFGRVGAPFAGHAFGVTPDLMTVAKGITNATVPNVPNLQMRQNLGSARVRGVEVQSFWAPFEAVRLSLAWTFTDARVTSGDLNGRALPQDPRHRIAAAASFADLRWFEADIGLRWTSDQFEDDRNVFRLPGFAVLDVQLSRMFAPGWTLFAAAENLLDRRYLVGLQGGVATVGQPLCVRAGVRARFF